VARTNELNDLHELLGDHRPDSQQLFEPGHRRRRHPVQRMRDMLRAEDALLLARIVGIRIRTPFLVLRVPILHLGHQPLAHRLGKGPAELRAVPRRRLPRRGGIAGEGRIDHQRATEVGLVEDRAGQFGT
jgi:hypothetical protein